MSKETPIETQNEIPQNALPAMQREKNRAAIELLKQWQADESGYDEAVWPVVKKSIEENRPSDRKRFHD